MAVGIRVGVGSEAVGSGGTSGGAVVGVDAGGTGVSVSGGEVGEGCKAPSAGVEEGGAGVGWIAVPVGASAAMEIGVNVGRGVLASTSSPVGALGFAIPSAWPHEQATMLITSHKNKEACIRLLSTFPPTPRSDWAPIIAEKPASQHHTPRR